MVGRESLCVRVRRLWGGGGEYWDMLEVERVVGFLEEDLRYE